jgi:hypothetical protein
MMLTKEFIFFIEVDGVSGVNEVIQIRCLLFFRNFRLIMQNSASAICGSPDFLPTTVRVLCRNPQNRQKTDKNRLRMTAGGIGTVALQMRGADGRRTAGMAGLLRPAVKRK